MDKYIVLNEFKDKIIQAHDYQDAKSIVEIALAMTSNNIEKKIINSLIFQSRYNKKMELEKFMLYMDILVNMKYYNDAQLIIGDIEMHINDNVQLNTLKRIIKNKPNRNIGYNEDIIKYKDCPHCGRRRHGSDDICYVICGYTNRGYDWKGCGKDWCFKCGKKLCKNWNLDMLFNKINRIHDGKCCKAHANKYRIAYDGNYCECSNEFVDRNQ